MRKLKVAALALAALVLMPVSYVRAEDYEQYVFTYRQAVDKTIEGMLPLQDLDLALRNMEVTQRDLREQVNRLNRGDVRQDAILEITESLEMMETALFQTRVAHDSINAQVDQSMAAIIAGAGVLGGEELNTLLGAATTGMVTTRGMGMEMTAMEQQRAALFAQLTDMHSPDFFNDMVDEARLGLYEFNRQLDNLRFSREIAEANMESAVRGILVVMAELDIHRSTLEAAIQLAEENLTRMVVSHQVGMISAHDLRTIENNLAGMHTDLQELIRSQDALRQNLNYLMGQPLLQYTVVEFDRVLPTIPSNKQQHMTQVINQCPTIRQLELALQSARAERQTYINRDRGSRLTQNNDRDLRITDAERRRALNNPIRNTNRNAIDQANDDEIRRIRNRIAIQDAVERAEAALEQAIRSMESAMLTGFNDLESLFIQIETHERELTQAEATLAMVEANFAAGRVTQFDVNQAQMAVTTAEQGIESIYNQMWILDFRLDNPSLLLS